MAYVNTQAPSAPAPWCILVYDGDHSAEVYSIPQYTSVLYLGGVDAAGDRSGLAIETGAGYDFALKVSGLSSGLGGIGPDSVELGTQTTGGYASSSTEGGSATAAIALAANGANCSGNQFAAGVDASGAAEGCGTAGDLTGPASASDEAVARYNGVTGKFLQSSPVTITDAGGLVTPGGSASLPAIALGGANLVGLYGAGEALGVSTGGTQRVTMDTNGIRLSTGAWVRNLGYSYEPIFTGRADDIDSGLGANAPDDMVMLAGYAVADRWLLVTSGLARSLTVGQRADTPQAATCSDSGTGSPGALTITPTAALVHVTVADPDGCAITMGETNVTSGVLVQLVVIAGAGTFSDTAGVTELAGAFAAEQYDALSLSYIADRWVETGRSDN